MRFSLTGLLFAAALLVTQSQQAMIYVPGLPIDPILIFKIQVACDRLENELRATYGTSLQRDFLIYAKIYMAEYFLNKLSKEPNIAQYNNMVAGDNSGAVGEKNIVIGNDNMIVGNSNYVFSKGFESDIPVDNSLVLDEWLIDLFKSRKIPYYGAGYAVSKWANTH